MNPRERVITALEHRQPDRPPVDLGGTVSGIHNVAYTNLIKELWLDLAVRVDPRDVQQLAKLDEPVLKRLGVDFRHVCLQGCARPRWHRAGRVGEALLRRRVGHKVGEEPALLRHGRPPPQGRRPSRTSRSTRGPTPATHGGSRGSVRRSRPSTTAPTTPYRRTPSSAASTRPPGG